MQSGLRSRWHPWSNLNKRNLHLAYLGQLGTRYDLDEELTSVNPRRGMPGIKHHEHLYVDCGYCNLILDES